MKTIVTSFVLLSVLAFTAAAQIVISEIHYHPVEEPAFNADGTPAIDLTDDVHEFVEIQNTGASAMNLAGWKLAGGISYTFPSNATVAAGAFRVIAKNPARIALVYSLAASNVLGPYTGHLGNNSDTVRVRDAADNVADSVTYDSKFPWAGSADALGAQDRFTGLTVTNYQYKGRSLQRVSVTWPASDPANWLASPLTGPTPGAPQAVTRTVPKPVVITQSAAQTNDGAVIVRAGNPVTVNCTFSATNSLSSVTLEYFVDTVDSTTETRTSVAMSDLGGGKYAAAMLGKPDRSIVRYRFKANRGEGLEVVSPRADDPQIAPIGASGAREAWHGYFVTPVRSAENPIYDVFVSTAALSQLSKNISQKPRRVTAATATGLPREVPYVRATDPLWDGTQPGVFACNGQVWDIQIRHHGSKYQRAATNPVRGPSFKLHFPDHQPFNGQTSWFETGHGNEFIEAQKLNRLLGLPSSKMRVVDWYFNSNAVIGRSEQGEYGSEMLDEYHKLQQQLNPGSVREENGELHKVVGNTQEAAQPPETTQNNVEGPYTKGDEAPMLANAGWTQLQRYDWNFELQNNHWKGPTPIRDLIEGMWTARGDSLASRHMNTNNVRSWFTNNFDMECALTSMALLQWIAIWDDVGHNHFYWRRANGHWVRLGWDYDQVMQAYRTEQSIYLSEDGQGSVFGTSWFKDTFFKAWRTEYNQRLWELNNSFFDPANLTALGFSDAAAFATNRCAYINAQLASLGIYYKPNRPTNSSPANGGAVVTPTNLVTSAYSHPQSTAHAATRWEIRTASGDYEEPVLRITSTNNKTAFPIPFDQLTYGQTYYWRVTHIDTAGHPSVVSVETSFSWGTTSTTAGTLVINEILADNRNTVQSGNTFPDYVEIRNNESTNITLTGYSLSDNPLNPTKFAFPANTTIAPGGYLLVWCDNDTSAPGLHSGFGLDSDGQTVLLMKGSTIVDSVSFGPQAPDISIGRIVNGTGGWQANTPTPLTTNSAKTLGSASRLRINEWMANPAYGEDWLEIYNTDSNVVALAGLYLSDTPATPMITAIPALSFIAGNGFTKFSVDGSAGGNAHANFKLNNGGESIVLTDVNGATTLDTITFGSQAKDVSQGRLPDGASTVVSFSSQTASPGYPNWAPASVYINEVLAHAHPPLEDAVEIYNPTASAVSIGGWWLSDDRLNRKKFQIPGGTMVAAGGYRVLYEVSFNAGAIPFSLSAWGDEAVLSAVDGTGALTGNGSLARFGPSPRNQAFGRITATGLDPDSGGVEYWAQVAHTLGQDNPVDTAQFRTGTGLSNSAPKIGPVVINEIMYHPRDLAGGADDTQDEFIELYNVSSGAVDLSGWRLRGDSEYIFATNTTLAAGGYLLLVSFDPTNTPSLMAFRATNNLSTTTPIYGPYSGKLANNTYRLELAYPDILDDSPVNYLVDSVEYRDIAPWPTTPDGGGTSLQRTNSSIIGNNAASWLGATPTPGAINAGVPAGLNITIVSPLPGGVVGSAYTNTFTAASGTPLYTWTISAGSVPGLSLATNGTFTGTPTTAGTNTFTAQVTDSAGSPATATKSLTIIIQSALLSITTSSPLPNGTVGAAYSQTLVATGGTSPYTWSLSAGALPPDVTLSGAGVVSGTPTASGTFNFTARVADSGGLAVTKVFAIFIPVPPLVITSPSPMLGAQLGTVYSQALTGVGGVTPYSWSIASGSLPAGLSLSGAGDVSGTPTQPGTFNFTARLTDSLGSNVTKALSLSVVPRPLVITTASMPDGIVGAAYSQTLAATGGVGPYTWSISAGTLPSGLSLSSNGAISGAPTTAGTSSFTAQITDSLNTNATKAFSITVGVSGPLDHFTWNYVPTGAYAGHAFAVRLTARDSAERVVASFNGPLNVSAASGTASTTSPILLTELTDENEDQFELQNVTGTPVDITGWFVIIGDSQTDINNANPVADSFSGTLPAGGLLRLTESDNVTAGRVYFGGPINWSSSDGTNSKGWNMLFDSQFKLRDFMVIGWDSNQLATLNVLVNGDAVTPAGHWTGNPFVPGSRGPEGTTVDSWQRIGTADSNTSADWVWRHNADNSDATSFNAANAGLFLPMSMASPVTMTPASLTLTNGEYIGPVTITQAASDVRLTAADDAGHTGASAALNVLAGTDGDSDGIADAWENANLLNRFVNDAALDPDGDGRSNLAEFLDGTDPQSSASLLAITSVRISAENQLIITWSGVAGKLYRLRTSADLVTWQPLSPRVLATTTGPQTATLDASGLKRLFVRVVIELSP